jgi:hypothetical protein
MTCFSSFQRPEHRTIAKLLNGMDADFLLGSHCYFGGGTAIVLHHGEYRLSMYVDFLCADREGYRALRMAATERGAAAFFASDVETIRPFMADQYGIRGQFALDGQRIKFEIVREARIELTGEISPLVCVPTLTVTDQFAEKLMANADRGLDRSVAYRVAIDLGYLSMAEGAIPTAGIAKAESAYGRDIQRYVNNVLDRLARPEERSHAATVLAMQPDEVDVAIHHLKQACLQAWPLV